MSSAAVALRRWRAMRDAWNDGLSPLAVWACEYEMRSLAESIIGAGL